MALLASGAAQAAARSGVYSNVCREAYTGDQGGVEVQLWLGPPTSATFVLCEGGCSPEPLTDLRVTGDTISFATTDQVQGADGKLIPTATYHYLGRLTSNALMLRSADRPDFGRMVLKRQHRKLRPPEGVALAGDRHVDGWPPPLPGCH